MPVTPAPAPAADPLMSVTGALVESNDRLLGLIALTALEPTSLDERARVQAIVDKARVILGADVARLNGTSLASPAGYQCGDCPSVGLECMSAREQLANGDEFELSFFRAEPFGTPDTKLLAAVVNLIANAVRTARMHQSALAQAAVAREHDAAAKITSAALPDPASLPQLPHTSIHASMTPARETGGDLYTWSVIDDQLWFAVGDVSGKGLPAAVLMTTVINAVEGAIRQHHAEGVGRVMEAIEQWAFRPLSSAAMFVTLAVARFSPSADDASGGGTLCLANAGHSPIVFGRDGHGKRLDATAPPVGVLQGLLPEVQTIEIRKHDLVVLATDGFTEQENADGVAYGEDRFDCEVAAFPSTLTAAEVGTQLAQQLNDHTGNQQQSDDRTLMVLRFGA